MLVTQEKGLINARVVKKNNTDFSTDTVDAPKSNPSRLVET